ncbi:MAG: hypothetical protein QXL88_02425 [Candidatus Pacearchaeota archaeon]
MIIKIEKQERKPLVEREEIIARFELEATPKKDLVQEELAKMLNKEKELVVVKHVYQQFGKHESKVIAYVYNSLEALQKFEKKKEKKKHVETETENKT